MVQPRSVGNPGLILLIDVPSWRSIWIARNRSWPNIVWDGTTGLRVGISGRETVVAANRFRDTRRKPPVWRIQAVLARAEARRDVDRKLRIDLDAICLRTSGPCDVVPGSRDETRFASTVGFLVYDGRLIEFEDVYTVEMLGCAHCRHAVASWRRNGIFDTVACCRRIAGSTRATIPIWIVSVATSPIVRRIGIWIADIVDAGEFLDIIASVPDST